MAEVQIAIAKETSVQEVSTKIGPTNSEPNARGADIFSRLRYLLNGLSGLSTVCSAARAGKISTIGTASDSTDTASVFGRLKGIKNAAADAVADPALRQTTEAGTDKTINILNEEITKTQSGSQYLAGFKVDKAGVYKISVQGKNTHWISTAYVYMRFTGVSTLTSSRLFTFNAGTSSYTTQTANIFLRAGYYRFYVTEGTGSWTQGVIVGINLIKAQYNLKKTSIFKLTTLASDNNSQNLTLSSSSGTNTSEQTISTYTASKPGSVKATVTVDSDYTANTQFYWYVNSRRFHYHDDSADPFSCVMDLAAGDVLTLKACTRSSSNQWSISAASLSFDTVDLGINPLYLDTWEEVE